MKRQSKAAREAWLKRRDRGVGGSDADVIMGTSPFSTPFELWARKTGRLRPQPQTAAMLRGLELEPLARRAYEKIAGVRMPPAELEHARYVFVRGNLDGLNRGIGRALEIKCPNAIDHGTAKEGRVPEKYKWQCVHLMLVAEVPALDYFSFDGLSGVIVPLVRNTVQEEELLQAEEIFWTHVIKDIPPPPFDFTFFRRKK